LTDDEKEELEEEARGERNRKCWKIRNEINLINQLYLKNVTAKTKQMAYANSDCDCSENEAWKNAWILKIINIKKKPY
jgi:hypothetical protein